MSHAFQTFSQDCNVTLITMQLTRSYVYDLYQCESSELATAHSMKNTFIFSATRRPSFVQNESTYLMNDAVPYQKSLQNSKNQHKLKIQYLYSVSHSLLNPAFL